MNLKKMCLVLILGLAVVGIVFAQFGVQNSRQGTQEAYDAGIRDGEKGFTPHPWPLPKSYADGGTLEDAYRKGYADGQEKKRTAELMKDGYKIEPFYRSEQYRAPTGEIFDDQSAGLNLVIPFKSPW